MTTIEIATLNHKVLDDTVEQQGVIDLHPHQFQEVVTMLWRLVAEGDADISLRGLQQYLCPLLRRDACAEEQQQAKDGCSDVHGGYDKGAHDRHLHLFLFDYFSVLAQADSLRRTNTCASTALCAEIGIDRILLTLRNCLNGALTLTCTASDAVVTNYICHNSYKCKLLIL